MSSPSSPFAEPSKPYVEFVRDERDLDREAFNRLRYAGHLLKILSPRVTVALCIGTDKLRVEQGGEPGNPTSGRWAIVSIPPDASRVHIAVALARLTGRSGEP